MPGREDAVNFAALMPDNRRHLESPTRTSANQNESAERQRAPLVSVIVPAHDAQEFLGQSLAALEASKLRDFECIVVDDGSACRCQVPDDSRFSTLRLDRRGGPARARNHGAARASAEILVFLDADVRAHPDTLERMHAHLTRHPEVDAVIGSYDDCPTAPSFVSQFKNLFHHYVHQHSARAARTFWSGCGAIRRSTFADTGGFDARFERPCIEDIELGYRLTDNGHHIDLEPAIQVQHLKRWTLMSMIRSDLFDRAIPWLRLMIRRGSMPNDLNAATHHRASVALVWLTLGALASIPWTAKAGLVTAFLAIAGLLTVNVDLYRFFLHKRGAWFALRAAPMHWLYYGYCGVAVVAAVALPLAESQPALGSSAPAGGAAADPRPRERS